MSKAKNTLGDRGLPSLAEEDADLVRLWLYLVKIVLPLEREVNQHLQQNHGQSLTRFDVLAQLDRFGDLSVGQLANRLIASAGNITSLLRRMESEGLLTRAPAADRRASLVQITAHGRRTYKALIPRHAEIVTQRLNVLDDTSRAQLAGLARDLHLRLSENKEDSSRRR